MKRSKLIDIPLYNCLFKIIDTDDIEYLQKNKFIGDTFKKDTELYARIINSSIDTKLYGTRECLYAIFNTKHKTTSITHGVIGHEALHCVNMLFESRGIVADRNNDEADAYMLAWFIDRIHEFLKIK